jgi:hypothetical protein
MAILDSFPVRALVCFPVALLLCMLPGCSSSAGVRERPIPLSQSNATAHEPAPSKPAQNAPPTDPEVRTAIQRLFGDDVQPESNPGVRFAAGDFNGDASQDLLVAVKPVKEKLPELNSDLANWTIQNPQHTHIPQNRQGVAAEPPPQQPQKVRAGEALLAVIHGYGPAGWRDPMARQAYLLRQAAGTEFRVSQPSKKLIHDFGAFPSARDVLAENLEGSTGVLYWTGAAYAWHKE